MDWALVWWTFGDLHDHWEDELATYGWAIEMPRNEQL